MHDEILETDEAAAEAAEATAALHAGIERAKRLTHDYDLLLHDALKPSGGSIN
jgi:hypothetical protein